MGFDILSIPGSKKRVKKKVAGEGIETSLALFLDIGQKALCALFDIASSTSVEEEIHC